MLPTELPKAWKFHDT